MNKANYSATLGIWHTIHAVHCGARRRTTDCLGTRGANMGRSTLCNLIVPTYPWPVGAVAIQTGHSDHLGIVRH